MSDVERKLNEHGKYVWCGITESTPFSSDMFDQLPKWNDNYQSTLHTNIGSITVVDRLTGFGWRDIETGFRDKEGKFWLASGGCDVRASGSKNFGEAIRWIKENANTCIPDRDQQ